MTSSNFEFSPSDSKPIRLISRISLVLAAVLAATALVRIVRIVQAGALASAGHSAFSFTDHYFELLSVLLPLIALVVASYQFFQSSSSFKAIVDTTGSDIALLQVAMNSLANGFYLIAAYMLFSLFRLSAWADEIHRCLSRLQ